MKENAIFLSSAMSKGFAPVSTTTQRPTRPTAPAVDAQEIQSKWLSYFEDLADPRGAAMSASSLFEWREDNSRIRQGHAPENFTLLRRLAISALNQESSSKRSVSRCTTFCLKRSPMTSPTVFERTRQRRGSSCGMKIKDPAAPTLPSFGDRPALNQRHKFPIQRDHIFEKD